MGQHTFEWPYPANEVYVTGTFDDWQQTVRLHKDDKSGAFVATIDLNLSSAEKILYKFVVDGNWTVLQAARTERDNCGIENNVLLADEMATPVEEKTAPEAFISSVSPTSTTAALAAEVPLVTDEAQQPSEAPTPALDDVPGGFPETPSANNATEEPTFSVKPMPASITPGNPIDLQPGQPVPDVSATTLDDAVRLDKESYEKADASNLGVGNFLPPVVTPAEERAAKGTGVLDIPEITSNMIPESSLPVASSENNEAVEVPDVVQKSQEQAHAEPEASSVPEAVGAKKQVESELRQLVPEAPAVEEKSTPAVIMSDDKPSETVQEIVHHSPVPPELHPTIAVQSHEPQTRIQIPAENVPEIVKKSIKQAHAPPEAAADPAEVELKRAVEEEVRKEVPEAKAAEPSQPKVAAAPARFAQPTIRKVEPEPGDQAFTQIVPGSFDGNATKDAAEADEHKFRGDDAVVTSPTTAAKSSSGSDKKSKRRSLLATFRNIFKDHKAVSVALAVAIVSITVYNSRP